MNGPTHQVVAGFATGVFLAERERQAGVRTAQPLLRGTAAAFLTKLPDILEPATSPNHRQFFHSLAFAALLGVALHELNKWQPESAGGELFKALGQAAIPAYLIHLFLDSLTAKSLPLVGR
ncbi:metal-dependent hydrolase [Roseateles sp.]|uniref:metal-dependent hydrolase n=1 Tax=Roseateles sp. TaxID=1971397 RepID=UPI0039EB3919